MESLCREGRDLKTVIGRYGRVEGGREIAKAHIDVESVGTWVAALSSV